MQEGSGSLETSPQDSSECPVCYEILEEPKQLSCGHSLCAHCTLVLAKHDNQKTKIECPQCRTNTVVPETGLPTNFALKGIEF
uniref:RING-type domain-containing protein n=1 Tax=Ditylenchus dipsaci TaxID=166011 RepID=A0A915EF47_9BILA